MPTARPSRWPKTRPPLNTEQRRALDDWYGYFLQKVQPSKFGAIERFGHIWALRSATEGGKTLKIGPGAGAHLRFEDIARQSTYIGVEIRPDFAQMLESPFPDLKIVINDCQKRLNFPDNTFNPVLAIHVLEHRYMPLEISSIDANLIIGLTTVPRKKG